MFPYLLLSIYTKIPVDDLLYEPNFNKSIILYDPSIFPTPLLFPDSIHRRHYRSQNRDSGKRKKKIFCKYTALDLSNIEIVNLNDLREKGASD
jgi:hypothetical protein